MCDVSETVLSIDDEAEESAVCVGVGAAVYTQVVGMGVVDGGLGRVREFDHAGRCTRVWYKRGILGHSKAPEFTNTKHTRTCARVRAHTLTHTHLGGFFGESLDPMISLPPVAACIALLSSFPEPGK